MSDLFYLPQCRDEWEEAWPNTQTRYLAWCHATRRSPLAFDGAAFVAWIDSRLAEFRAALGIKDRTLTEAEQDAFTARLWL